MTKEEAIEKLFEANKRGLARGSVPHFDPSGKAHATLKGARLAAAQITGEKIKDNNLKVELTFGGAELQRETYEMVTSGEEQDKFIMEPRDKVSVEARDIDRWRKNTDSNTEDWECPEDSPYCVSHHQLVRCKMDDQHGPDEDSEIPRITMHVSLHKKVRPEVKVFMEGQGAPVAFGRLVFESTEGARAFADALIEHGVVGYVVHSEGE